MILLKHCLQHWSPALSELALIPAGHCLNSLTRLNMGSNWQIRFSLALRMQNNVMRQHRCKRGSVTKQETLKHLCLLAIEAGKKEQCLCIESCQDSTKAPPYYYMSGSTEKGTQIHTSTSAVTVSMTAILLCVSPRRRQHRDTTAACVHAQSPSMLSRCTRVACCHFTPHNQLRPYL